MTTPAALRPEALAPAKPVKRSRVRRFVLLGLVGLVETAGPIALDLHASPDPTCHLPDLSDLPHPTHLPDEESHVC